MDINEALEMIQDAIFMFDEESDKVKDTRSFEDSLLLTGNKGFILKMRDGSEFQITVVKSK